MSWEDVLSDSEFQQQPDNVKEAVARNYFADRIASDPEFQKQPEDIRLQTEQNFLNTIKPAPDIAYEPSPGPGRLLDYQPEKRRSEGGYGLRADGTQKGLGYFGELKRPDKKISTELSIGVGFDGKETQIPTLVPTLTRNEINYLLEGNKPTKEIQDKAIAHAKTRMDQGKSPFAEKGEQGLLPQEGQPIIEKAGQFAETFARKGIAGTKIAAEKAIPTLKKTLYSSLRMIGESIKSPEKMGLAGVAPVILPKPKEGSLAYKLHEIEKPVGTGLSRWAKKKSKEVDDELREIANKMPEELRGRLWDNPQYLLDPQWMFANIGDAAVSFIPTIVAGLVGGPGAAGVVGGSMEGLDLYDQLINEGVDHNRAMMASSAFGIVTGLLNTIGMKGVLSPKAGAGFVRKLLGHAGAAALEAGTEWAEEPFQAAFQGLAEEKSIPEITAMVADSLKNVEVAVGAWIMGGAGSIVSPTIKPSLKPDGPTQSAIENGDGNSFISQVGANLQRGLDADGKPFVLESVFHLKDMLEVQSMGVDDALNKIIIDHMASQPLTPALPPPPGLGETFQMREPTPKTELRKAKPPTEPEVFIKRGEEYVPARFDEELQKHVPIEEPKAEAKPTPEEQKFVARREAAEQEAESITKPQAAPKKGAVTEKPGLTLIRNAGGINPETTQGEAARYTRKEEGTIGLIAAKGKGISADQGLEMLVEAGKLPEGSTVRDFWDYIDRERAVERKGKQTINKEYATYLEGTYGQDWRQSEEFGRDEAQAKTDLKDELIKEIERDEGATEQEVKALIEHYDGISIEDELGGRAAVIPTEKGKVADIADINAGDIKRRGFFENTVKDLSERGFESVRAEIQTADSQAALARLVEKGILTNPREPYNAEEYGVSVEGAETYPTLFDINKEYSETKVETKPTEETEGVSPTPTTETETTRQSERGEVDIASLVKFGKSVPRAFLKIFEPTILARRKVGREPVAAVMRGTFGKRERAMVEFDQTKVDAIDRTIGQLERDLDKYPKDTLENIMLSRGETSEDKAREIQNEARTNLPPEIRDSKIEETLNEIADFNYRRLQEVAGDDINKVDNYFYGIYKNPKKTSAFLSYWKTTERFTKEKVFPTYADAKAYGLEIRNPNPITNLRSEYGAIAQLGAMQWLHDELMRTGKGIYIEDAKTAPEDWEVIGEGMRPEPTFRDVRVEPNLAKLINNLISTNKITQVPVLNAIRNLNNVLRTVKFIGSGFHLLNIAKQSVADTGYGAVYRSASRKGVTTGFRKNDPIFQTPEYKDYVENGGGHKYSVESEARKAFARTAAQFTKSQRAAIRTASLPVRIPVGFVDWMFESYIPKVKYAKYLDYVGERQKKLGRELTPGEKQEIIKEQQNFYGMMNERLFGRSGTVTTLLRFWFMAPGYAEGNYRTMIKAATQWGGKKGFRANRSRSNIVNSLIITGILATAGTMIMTGKPPEKPETIEEVRDLLKIDTGRVDENGDKIMIDLATYDKDYFNVAFNTLRGRPDVAVNESIRRVGGMKAPTGQMMVDLALMAQGKAIYDWKEDRVYHVTDPWLQKVLKTTVHEVQRITPISTSVFKRARQREADTTLAAVESLLGLRPSTTERSQQEFKIIRDLWDVRDKREKLSYTLDHYDDPQHAIEVYNRTIEKIIDNKFITPEIKEKGESLFIDPKTAKMWKRYPIKNLTTAEIKKAIYAHTYKRNPAKAHKGWEERVAMLRKELKLREGGNKTRAIAGTKGESEIQYGLPEGEKAGPKYGLPPQKRENEHSTRLLDYGK